MIQQVGPGPSNSGPLLNSIKVGLGSGGRKVKMRQYGEDEAAKLEAQPWMVALLERNPSYVHWGPHEDCMWNKDQGWTSPVVDQTWAGFGFKVLDEYNEVAHFYFEIARPSEQCATCDGRGYHPDALWVSESWYEHKEQFAHGAMPPSELLEKYSGLMEHCKSVKANGGGWYTAITQDEVDALWDGLRLTHEFKEKPTAEQVNTWAGGRGFGHDAINSWICIEQRLKRLGIPKTCPVCEGDTRLFTGPAYMQLVLWVLHPRKGASRGVEVRFEEHELPEVLDYLREAAQRSADRFKGVTA
jgi:hypothetical protein